MTQPHFIPPNRPEPDRLEKPLKRARSQAELIRTRNSNIILCYATVQTITNVLVALKVFHVI